MSQNDWVDLELHERIEHFLAGGYFEKGTMEHGIALFVADNGLKALSPKQRVVWDKAIEPILRKPINAEERMHEALERDREEEAKYWDEVGKQET